MFCASSYPISDSLFRGHWVAAPTISFEKLYVCLVPCCSPGGCI